MLTVRNNRMLEFENLKPSRAPSNYVCSGNSKTFSPQTIALTQEAKLWEDTRSSPRDSAVNYRKGQGMQKTKIPHSHKES